jgi:repressor LexA
MGGLRTDMTDITNEVSGKSVSHVTQPDLQRLEIHFTDNSILAIALLHGHLTAAVTCRQGDSTSGRRGNGFQPTRRQRDYLEFIARYNFRYGVSPAESDIARHFLVSAPSVNQMVQMLERRGFITRQPGIPRSITIVDDRKNLIRPTAAGGRRRNNALHRT